MSDKRIKFNLNQKVRVKLTKHGHKIHRRKKMWMVGRNGKCTI